MNGRYASACMVARMAAISLWCRDSSAAEGALGGSADRRLSLASMGPRLFSRGRSRPPRARTSSPWFNGAAALQPRKAAGSPRSAVGTSCFNGAAALQPRKAAVASVGCGSVATLQWGRGSSAAEGRAAPTSSCPHRSLQWGRGSSAAEGTFSAVPRIVRGTSFNGAAALQPRKGGAGPAVDPVRPASMGPRLFSRGRRAAASAGEARRRCFNGAAALQPRKDPLQG